MLVDQFLFIILLFLLTFTNAYGQDQNSYQHYDEANIKNRTYGTNFKDFALLNCLQVADKKLNNSYNEDLQKSTGTFLQEWIAFDAEDIDKTKITMREINRLSEKYISDVGGLAYDLNATVYTLGCLNFYHSDELDNLMHSFVIRPKMTFREEYTD